MLRLVSFTSVSHFGIMIIGIFAFSQTSVTGSALYMFNHGLSTGALFFAVAYLIQRHGSASVKDYGGLQKVAPVLAGTFLIIGLSALSLPGLSPFISEILVFIGAFPVVPVAIVFAALGVVLAALYILLTYKKVFTGPTPPVDGGNARSVAPRTPRDLAAHRAHARARVLAGNSARRAP